MKLNTSLSVLKQMVVVTIVVLSASNGFAGSANIDQMSGWSTCSACALRGGTGKSVSHSLQIGVSSPSLDGRSVQFNISGSFPFADAIWWRQLGGTSATKFTLDLYFYIKDPGASEALEFDVNQSAGGRRYTYGTQCGINYDHQWDVWDTGAGAWRRTGIGCSVKAFAWNHLTWQFYRSNGQIHYVSVTLNGKTSYVNRTYNSRAKSGSELNVAFQMDQTGVHRPYSVWLDRVNLSY